ncbi:putative UDP-glucuronosyl/UDP-glucosyltransferase [Medicago truncatula]|uniref:Glycosyltransferase n=1 Tax=Medicago truncatula TaxID=3880 RepID=G7L446_MEDTR|nr:UDP-glucose flavonoid 3-O-glucosyltransferase 7 [Medicago truncatula]AES77563.1 UDP-glucosyltransferase family protein [Medicago truncatula]QJD08097.1 UDP-glucuronosyl/UDP-glucosyltransferase [Medicago truncatula]RHN44338.1 putative UDP-glucuronosyl/UDP-glucosyltransferase [Medicago truncatula]
MNTSAMVGVEVERPLKIHFIPYLASSHMIPLSDIAAMFASHGQHVTIITTPSNAKFLTKSLSYAAPFFLRLHTVDFPFQQMDLPEGIESISSTTDLVTTWKINNGAMLLHRPIEDFIKNDPPDCIISDSAYPWVNDLAQKLQIPNFTYNVLSVFPVLLMESLRTNNLLFTDSDSDSSSYIVPNFPLPITMCSKPPKVLSKFIGLMLDTVFKSNGFIVNNFIELDGEECIQHYEKTVGHKAWHLGPSSIWRTTLEKSGGGNEGAESEHECLRWLNSQQVNSVLYICFGSLNYFSDKQLYEIAYAIEASGHPFIWVVLEKKGKEDENEEEKEKWLPKGFEERNIGKKGLIVRGWAPQVQILSHPAVGGFMTHCGGNSFVEAVGAGVPMITWPGHGDQLFNEKLITQVRGIGVEVGATEWRAHGIGERKKLVSRDDIEKAMRRLMDSSDEAEGMRLRARELGEKAKRAIQEGGSSHHNLLTLIDELKKLRDCKPLD